MKIFEFGAAGLPVVASATAELRRRKLPFVALADSADEFARLCAAMANGGAAPAREQARSAALEHSWKVKAQRLFTFAETLRESPRARRASGA
jgi:hypothetical protein